MTGGAEQSQRARAVIPHGVNSPVRHYEPYPFFVDRSDGCHVWDTDGRRIVDLCNGYGSLLLGHRHPDIVHAVREQLGHGTLFCMPTELETSVSEMLCGMYPSIQSARMVNTGGEATMTAIRLARGYTGRSKIVMFEGGYHGAHDAVLAKAGSGVAQMSGCSPTGIPPETPSSTLLARYNDPDSLADMLDEREDVAAVIIEPVMANMGLIPPDKEFLEKVRRITKQNDVILIFDEVVTGFRMSPGGAQSYYSITPDITTLAKILGGGFGAAAVGGRRNIMENLAPGGDVYQASTFAGNPVAASASIASMTTIRRQAGTIYKTLDEYCRILSAAISDAATDLHIPHHVNRISSMVQIFFTNNNVRDYNTAKRSNTQQFSKLFDALLDRRIFIAPSQFETIFLSTAMNVEDISYVSESYAEALKNVIQ